MMLALITATRDSMATLPSALGSVEDVKERIKLFFVDNDSTDGTTPFLQSYVQSERNSVLLSQEGTGLYQALNQGIRAAIQDPEVTHIGLLHSDDILIPDAYSKHLMRIEETDALVFYSDIQFHNSAGRQVRTWDSGRFSRFKLSTGWMPPHTSMIVAKEVYEKIGFYNPDFGTAADYEWIVRVLSEFGEQSRYLPESTLSMLVGGASSSSLRARLRANAMDGKVWADNSRLQGILVRICKPLRKIGQFKLV
jgi:glycosyltransferase involved in cell wall biosynthesis